MACLRAAWATKQNLVSKTNQNNESNNQHPRGQVSWLSIFNPSIQEAKAHGSLWVWIQPSLCSNGFQSSLDYIVSPCLKKKSSNQSKFKKSSATTHTITNTCFTCTIHWRLRGREMGLQGTRGFAFAAYPPPFLAYCLTVYFLEQLYLEDC